MDNYSPTWAAYRSLMACRLVALNKHPWVLPIGIGETLRLAITKLVMRAAEDQANMVCGILQLCAGLKAVIEGAAHAVAQMRNERHALDTGGEADKRSEGAEEKSAAETSGMERVGEAARIGGIGEVTRPPR